MTTPRTEMSEEQKLELFANLMQTDISNIETVPDAVTFRPGSYELHGAACKLDYEKGAILVGFAMASALTVYEEHAVPVPKEGELMYVRYSGELGVKRFRTRFGKIMEHMGTRTIESFAQQFEGLAFLATVTARQDREKRDVFYNDIREIYLPEMEEPQGEAPAE